MMKKGGEKEEIGIRKVTFISTTQIREVKHSLNVELESRLMQAELHKRWMRCTVCECECV